IIDAVREDSEGGEYIDIRLHVNDRLVSVTPHDWVVYSLKVERNNIISEPIGTFTQYPLLIAWAITIHTSSVKTLESVVIDIGIITFVSGQMYVALSRCTSFEGIILKTPIKPHNIRTDYRIFKFLTGYQYKKSNDELSLNDKIALLEQAIRGKT